MSNAAPAPAPKSKKPIVMIAALSLAGVLLAGGGAAGAAWFVLQRARPHGNAESPKPVEKKKKEGVKPEFSTMDPFTVNLQDGKGERYAQIGLTLQLDSIASLDLLRERMPAVRNEILLLIASKHVDELLSDDGKRQLAQQIRTRAGRAMGWEGGDDAPPPPGRGGNTGRSPKADVDNPVQDVLFSQFIVQ